MTPQLPNLELLESQHKFPGPFMFKIIGDAREDFLADALNLTMSALKEDREFTHTTRKSSAGNHVAVTLSIRVESAQEVHSVYEKLLTMTGLRALF